MFIEIILECFLKDYTLGWCNDAENVALHYKSELHFKIDNSYFNL